ncbi:MAG: right-handed parallel beta-helix repeat-containing protein [Candidatus Zixiibacteriota bacterium]
MRLTLILLLISMLASASVLGTGYYVAPDGDDADNGLTPETAWESVDRGNTLGLVHPGDTVYIFPGTYPLSSGITLTLSGNVTDRIYYYGTERNGVIVDGQNSIANPILITGSYTELQNITVMGSTDDAIVIEGSYNRLLYCCAHDAGDDGIRVDGSYAYLFGNTVYNAGDNGINCKSGGNYYQVYNSTIYDCVNDGIEIEVTVGDCRAVNNIISSVAIGIDGYSYHKAAHNLIYDYSSLAYDGISDSAGGVLADPQLYDPANGNLIIKATSPAINNGMNVGFPYNGSAPDIGAYEKFNVYYVSTIGDDHNNGLTTGTAWATLEHADTKVIPGDSVFVLAGTYTTASTLTADGGADDYIHYIGVADSTSFDGSGKPTIVEIAADYTNFHDVMFVNGTSAILKINGNNNIIRDCAIKSGLQNGIRIESGSGNTVLNCVFRGNLVSGIAVDDDNNKIYNSTFYDSKNTALDAFSCDIVAITNCLFKGGASSNICIKAKATATVTYSIFDGFGSNTQGGVILGAGCLIDDPLMIDPANGDYRLSYLSPAIDKGTDLGYSYSGTAPDMGAFETKDVVSLTIIHSYDSLFADSQYQFEFEALDEDGNPANPGTLTWGHTFGSGSIDADGLFTPQYTGTGTITLESDLGFSDATGTLEVVAGELATLSISPNRDTLTTDDTQLFTAAGEDANGNTVIGVGTITWDVQGNIGDIDASGLFTPKKVGVGFIKASAGAEIEATTDSIFVTAGTIAYIITSPQSNSVEESTTQQFTAAGFDADSNLVGDVTGAVAWSTTDPTGSVDAAGLYTAGTNISPPSYYVIAVYGGSMYDSSTVSVFSNGALSYIQIELSDGTVVSDTSLSTDNDSTVLYCRGYDSGDNLLGNTSVTWSVSGVDGIGSVDAGPEATTTLVLHTPGSGKVVAEHESGIKDSTGTITCLPGAPAQIVISPDTATVSSDSTKQFTCASYDADGNTSAYAVIPTWSVLGGIGTINASGVFTPTTTGTGDIVATGPGIADTTTFVTVTAGRIVSFSISPNTTTIGVHDSIQFSVIALDSDSNATSPGTLNWQVLGSVGDIMSDGLFIADAPGVCSVMVTNNLGNIDISGAITIEALYASTIPISTYLAKPGQDDIPLLALQLENYYSVQKSLSSFTIHDISRGAGNSNDLLYNYDSIGLYYDIDDDAVLTEDDSLICHSVVDAEDINIMLETPFEINPGDSKKFFFCGHISKIAHDGDSLDQFLYTSTDIIATDGSIIDGPDSINSLGYAIINGLVAAQLEYTSVGLTEIDPSDALYPVMAVDIPRNGYFYDTLTAFGIVNEGTASSDDFDSLVLFVDNGNRVWDGPGTEVRIGKLINTGSDWIRSGFSVPLLNWTNRFYVAANLSSYPEDGATIAMTIATNGLEMRLENDGPYDTRPVPLDTITIVTNEAVILDVAEIAAQEIIPGSMTALTIFSATNGYATPKSLDSLRITLSFPGNNLDAAADLLSQVDSLYLYHEVDGLFPGISGTDSLLGAVEVSALSHVISFGNLSIEGGGGTEYIGCYIKSNLRTAKNNNIIRAEIHEMTDIFTDAVSISASVPLYNALSHAVNAFPAEAILVHQIEGTTLFGGQMDRPVLDFELPRDGYSTARLHQISLRNVGTVKDSAALQVTLWRDVGNDGFTDDDVLVGNGSFLYFRGVWTLANLYYSLTNVTTRFCVTVDVKNTQFIGGTLDFEIATDYIDYLSGTTGPDDIPVGNDAEFLVFPSNRITAISVPTASSEIRPGSSGNKIFTFALYNGYTLQEQTLKTLSLRNISRSASNMEYADYELGQIYLYLDADGNRIFDDDSLIATGYFSDSILYLSGLDVTLAPEELSYFFVANDVPPVCIDSDSLAVAISTPSAFGFENTVNINGDLPLTSGGYAILNGSVKEQYTIIETPPRTLSPGDSSITLYTFIPAFNGNQTDALQAIVLDNSLDADTSDISLLTLWKDINGDALWQETDSLVGTFAYSGSTWNISLSGLAVDSEMTPLMVLADISADATPGAAFQAQIPVNGCTYASANDGPIDGPLITSSRYTISNSPLRVDFASLGENYSIGQTIAVSMSVTNLNVASVDNVVAEIIDISAPTLVTFDSSSAGPVSIPSGGTQEFTIYYTAAAVGTITWQMRAFTDAVPDSSAVVQSETVSIQAPPTDVAVDVINSMPNSATRGQANIFPLSITIMHPESSTDYSALRLDSLEITVIDGDGAELSAADIFSNMLLATGYQILTIVTAMPASPTVNMVFSEPVFIEAGEARTFSLLVSIAGDAAVGDFALKISDASAIPVTDKNTGDVIALDPSITFPLQTATCRIDLPSTEMVVAAESIHSGSANYGQDNLPVLQLHLRHPGETGSSQIQFTGFGFEMMDNLGATILPSEILGRLSLQYQSLIIGEVSGSDLFVTQPEIEFNTPVTLSAQQVDSVQILVSLKQESLHDGFSIRIPDSSVFQVRDLSSGSFLAIATDTTLVTGSAFPMMSDVITMKNPAQPPEGCLVSQLPASIVSGVDGLAMLDVALKYPVSSTYSSLIIEQVSLQVLDSTGIPLDPNALFDRIGYRLNNSAITYQSFIEIENGAVKFNFDNTAIDLQPGDSLLITLVGDIESDVPYDNFVLQMIVPQLIICSDQSEPLHTLGIVPAHDCSLTFPYITEVTKVFLPAGRPHVSFLDPQTRIVHPGQTAIRIFDGSWTYSNDLPQGDISIEQVAGDIYSRTSSGLHQQDGAAVFSAVRLYINDILAATDTALSGSSLLLAADGDVTLSLGDDFAVRIECDLQDDIPEGNYLISFTDSTFMTMADRNLATPVYPIVNGMSYPLYSEEISVVSADLEHSFTNFPNPFNISQGETTTIGYSLSEDSYVDIEIFTITGEAVAVVADNIFRGAGTHQSETWNGKNGVGQIVIPGTYFCRITARSISGKTESYKRKIAVIR